MPFPGLSERLADIRERIDSARSRGGHGNEVRIVAVTKGYGPEAPEAAHAAGIDDVGENRVQEAIDKMDALDPALKPNWHLIGHLQRNKVKHLARFAMLHSLDNARLADEISAWASGLGLRVRVLVQVNASGEESKGGYALADLPREAERLRSLGGVEIVGTMTMAPFDAPADVLRTTFAGAREAGRVLVEAGHRATELSMGMSNDFEIAVEEGATMVRLGTILFGARAQ